MYVLILSKMCVLLAIKLKPIFLFWNSVKPSTINPIIKSKHKQMESLISSYGIPFYQFQKACIEYNAVVAGSSALYSYLKQENIDPGFEPNDIDIFLPSRMYRNDRPGRPLSIPSDEFSYTLLTNGFVENIRINSGDYYDNINSIASVITYTNSSGKNIQIISINYNGPLTSYISEQFDISVCISWWNASINKFETLCPALTLRKEMYITRNDAMSKLQNLLMAPHNYQGRISKYNDGTIDRICDIMEGNGEQYLRMTTDYRKYTRETKYP